MTVVYNKLHRTYDVVDANRQIVKGGFATQEDAWKWADGQDQAALDMADRHRRVQTAFAER